MSDDCRNCEALRGTQRMLAESNVLMIDRNWELTQEVAKLKGELHSLKADLHDARAEAGELMAELREAKGW